MHIPQTRTTEIAKPAPGDTNAPDACLQCENQPVPDLTKQPQPLGVRERAFKSREEAEAYLSDLSECISDVEIVSEEPFTEIGYAGGSLGVADVHRGAVPQLKWRASESDCFHFLFAQRGKLVLDGGGHEAEAGRSALLLPPSSRARVRARRCAEPSQRHLLDRPA